MHVMTESYWEFVNTLKGVHILFILKAVVFTCQRTSVSVFGCHSWGWVAASISWVGTRDATKYLTVRRTASHNRESSRPKHQPCGGEKPCVEHL